MDYSKRLNELIELCQDTWVTLQQREQQHERNLSTGLLHQATHDLHLGIKKLVQLQNEVDENGAVVKDSTWTESTERTMEDVRRQLQRATAVLSDSNNASSSTSSTTLLTPPIKLSATQSTPALTSSTASVSTTMSSSPPLLLLPERSVGSSASSISSSIINSQIPEEQDPLHDHPKPSSSTNTQNTEERSFGRRSIHAEEWPPVQPSTSTARRLRMLPLFKGLQSTRSTPLPGAQAQINFFKDDNEGGRKEIFACDAIVNQPIRIGVGYGSYICYSCTVLSDKGPPISVRKRYSDFVELREELVRRYPRLKSSIPKLPPKKVVGKFTPAFVEQRRRDLEYFFKYVVLHPTLGTSPIITQWIAP
ncbi:predicted protein [Lichtheimia corymbifera JMRC:FSU:9682]|uniref:PX domain-containing protein n=1 Tax=Lichtheimia corymbifera JMRC:FSU:9682 TaxID=1263082 RepID=A0A068SBS8_9FUNG|nr:predicted protein [Lichtheimia corymbifera JMRC:FSU:9682]